VRASTHPTLAESIGIAAVLVQAKDAAARAWYLGQAEWLEVTAGGRTLWFPVGVVGGEITHPTACWTNLEKPFKANRTIDKETVNCPNPMTTKS
jgi:hypothetical protein